MFAEMSTQEWAFVLILAGAVATVFKLLMASKDAQLAAQATQYEARLKDLDSQRKSYKEIAEEAVLIVESKVNQRLDAAGHPATKVLASVVPEHSSPVSVEQQATADLQTLRARITAATLASDLPPREAGRPETSPEKPHAG
jgi:Flp pilus assembly protein TadB